MRSLYLSHIGMSEPLGRSQCLPYLLGLARLGFEIDIVAFEHEDTPSSAIDSVGAMLRSAGVAYHPMIRTKAHGLGRKAWESALATGGGLRIALAKRPKIVHGRSYLPSAVGDVIASLVPRAQLLFDCRGLLADEYVDGGNWQVDDVRYRLTKRFERRLFHRADGVVVLSEAVARWLRDEDMLGERTALQVVPCCVDTSRFVPDLDARTAGRGRLGIGQDDLVVVYSGTLGTWYQEAEMAEFVGRAFARRPDLHFVVYTRYDTTSFRASLVRAGLPESRVHVESVKPDDMPRALAVGDIGLSFIQPCFSKISSSPTKNAEYLACGLVTVANAGIGDVADLARNENACVVTPDLSSASIRVAVDSSIDLVEARSPEARAEITRRVAVEDFSLEHTGVPRYAALYRELASR